MPIILKQNEDRGYTLIEVLVTIVIMGTIILVVNVVMISIIRVSYTTDARIKIRQNVEFATEVFRRAARNAEIVDHVPTPAKADGCGDPADPLSPMYQYGTAFQMTLGGGSDTVIFYADKDESANPLLNCKTVLKARWNVAGEQWDVFLTSPSEAVLNDDPDLDCNFWPTTGFSVQREENEDTGTIDIILNITADSAMEKTPGEPVVDCVIKRVSVLKRPSEL